MRGNLVVLMSWCGGARDTSVHYMCMYIKMHFISGMVLSRGRVFFLALSGCGVRTAPIGTLRRMSGPQPSSVVVL